MNYYLLLQDRMVEGSAGVRGLPDDMDPMDWIQGKVMPAPPSPIRLMLSENSGDFRGDVIQSLVTLYSDKLRNALTTFGVDNVDFFSVELEHPKTRHLEGGYWLTNVIGLVHCVDLAKSKYKPLASGTGIRLKAFSIDEDRAPEQPLFRLDEKPTLVVINEPLKTHLDAAGLTGVRLVPTEHYDGY